MKRDEFNASARTHVAQAIEIGEYELFGLVGCAHKTNSEELSALDLTICNIATVYLLNLSLFKRFLPSTTDHKSGRLVPQLYSSKQLLKLPLQLRL